MRKHLPVCIATVMMWMFATVVARADPLPPGAVAVLWQAAEELYTLGSYSGAIQTYEQIATLLPTESTPLVIIGRIYLAQQRWPLAVDAFNRALARRIDEAAAWAGLASVSWAQNEITTAVTYWQTALRYQPDFMPARLGLALALLHQGHLEEASATLETGLAMVTLNHDLSKPDQWNVIAAAHLLHGAILALNRPIEARNVLLRIPEDVPEEIRDQQDQLLAALNRAVTLRSPAQRAKHIGLALMQVELWPLARIALTRAYTLQPADTEVVAALGRVEAMMGFERAAWEHLSAAVLMRPEWSSARLWLGAYCRRRGLLHLAVMQLRTAVALEPANLEAWLELAQAYLDLGNYAQAEQALLTAVAQAPRNVDIQLTLVRFYADRLWHVADRGLAAAQAAAKMAPQDAAARDLLGWMYLLAGDLGQARLHLLSALTLDPKRASTYYHLGRLYLVHGFEEYARSAFWRVVDLDKTGQLRARALDLLAMLDKDRIK
ncbi:MAG: tetratricopeptide repeat protein [Anaerolineae bacterium]|nr:tetratricopeptide repeat protein [Anaerolineae bacterium]